MILCSLVYAVGTALSLIPVRAFVPRQVTVASVIVAPAQFHRSIRHIGYSTLETTKALATTSAETTTLTFSTIHECQSEPIPSEHKEAFVQYFSQLEFRKIFFSRGGQREVEELLDDTLRDYWEEKARQWDPPLQFPNIEQDRVIITDASLKFPGLTVTSRSCSGLKEQPEAKREGSPQYDLLLIAEITFATGLPPMVWIFNKLTGNRGTTSVNDSPATSTDQLSPTPSKIKGNVALVDSDDGSSFVIRNKVDLQIIITFPRFLLRILPGSKEKTESQGSAACLKSISKEMKESVDAAYADFHSTRRIQFPVPDFLSATLERSVGSS